MERRRTPDARWADLPGRALSPRYAELPDRLRRLDVGRSDEPVARTAHTVRAPVGGLADFVHATARAAVPGARGRTHHTVTGAGHFLQEDRGQGLADVIAGCVAADPRDD